jgi:hypothetical protein
VKKLEKQDKNQYSSSKANEKPQGFFASLESLSKNLLDYVVDDESTNKQEDQLH